MKNPTTHRDTARRISPGRMLLSLLLLLALPACKGKGDGFGNLGDSPYGSGSFDSDRVDMTPLPGRNEGVSLYGPGSEHVNTDLFSPVYFSFDSSSVSASEMPKVDSVARYMTEKSRGSSIIIGGFTDSVGTEEYNRQLGELRSLSVRSELLIRGVPPDRIQTVSFGEDMPAVPGSTPQAHSANRRCEFGLVE